MLKTFIKKTYNRYYSLPFYRHELHDYEKSSNTWGYFTLVTAPVIILVFTLTKSRHHHELTKFGPGGPEDSCMRVLNKDYQWGDGKTSFLDYVFEEKRRRLTEKAFEDHTKGMGIKKRKC